MPTRIPLDVDLEDRLIYGLSPVRFGYAALALLVAMAAWHSLPGALGLAAAALTVLAGVALAWGRIGGRGFDAWLLAIARYLLRTYRVDFDRASIAGVLARLRAARHGRPRLARPRSRPPSEWTPRLLRPPAPAPGLRVLPGWEPDT